MPSYNAVWIPTIAVAYVLAFAFLLYAWEHMYGTVSRFIRPGRKASKADESKEEVKGSARLRRGQKGTAGEPESKVGCKR